MTGQTASDVRARLIAAGDALDVPWTEIDRLRAWLRDIAAGDGPAAVSASNALRGLPAPTALDGRP